MKFFGSQLSALMTPASSKMNRLFLWQFLGVLLLMVVVYSVLFHFIMAHEDRYYSWITGVYWTLTVMSTLGFGDITFVSDMGKAFSILVLISGVLFLLLMLPFTFTQYVYAPWLEAQKKNRVPRAVAPTLQDHVIIIGVTPAALNLAEEIGTYGFSTVCLCNDPQQALDLVDRGFHVVVGDYDTGKTYASLNIEKAALVVSLENEMRNTNIAFTIREHEKDIGLNSHVPVLARAEHQDGVDILELAGCTAVFQFHKLLGEGLSRRIINKENRSSIIDHFGDLVVAEAPVMRTGLVGKTPVNCGVRQHSGVNIVGLWERGKFKLPRPNEEFTANTVLVLAGTEAQMQQFNIFAESMDLEEEEPALVQVSAEPTVEAEASPKKPAPNRLTALEELKPVDTGRVLILGGGRVGKAAADFLRQRGVSCCIVEREGSIRHTDLDYVQGDASDRTVLEQAGLNNSPAVVITTHDDDINIYLTIYCRRLRPAMQIISRANLERNVGILHAAGADLVLSLSSVVTSNVINMLSPGRVFMLNEGLSIFRTVAGKTLAGHNLMSSGIRVRTNCSVVAVHTLDGTMLINPHPEYVFAHDDDVYIIGDRAAEQKFYELYGCSD
ncbi:MAG: NAD-binding protein [Desulfovibrionaceae bacterium]|nr:NAD-binding protein [Desulfovibrionaceae bacterium]